MRYTSSHRPPRRPNTCGVITYRTAICCSKNRSHLSVSCNSSADCGASAVCVFYCDAMCQIGQLARAPNVIFLTFQVTVPTPVGPWGGHVTFAIDNCGYVYAGVGGQGGIPGESVSATAGWTMPWSNPLGAPSETQTQNVVESWSLSAEAAAGIQAGFQGNTSGGMPTLGVSLGSPSLSVGGTITSGPLYRTAVRWGGCK
jgi:hypothetical protein